jgi:hypothetical protein
MRLTFCVACGATDDLQHHHLVTRAEGGSDDENNLITLCCGCHHKVHSRQMNGTYDASQRTKAALAAAKARGVVIGGLRDKGVELQAEALERAEALREVFAGLAGLSHRGVAKTLNERGIRTATGKAWTAVQVTRVRERLGLKP